MPLLQVTVLGEATKAHILAQLLPSTTYDIKLQAFNLEGGVSAFSQIITERTEGESSFPPPPPPPVPVPSPPRPAPPRPASPRPIKTGTGRR